jgi:hypothetical protein
MFHRFTANARVRAPALVLALGMLAPAVSPAAAAQSIGLPYANQESGNPINDQGSNYNYRSSITAVSPSVAGLSLQVLEFADRLLLENHTGKTVTVYGYEGEAYARVLANGTVEVNTRSPAYYLNQSFYGQVTVPPSATAHAQPRWTVIDRTGTFEWHDHRIHWMSPVPPAKVANKSKRTLIFDWQVPISVGSSTGSVEGQLFWEPEEGTKTPIAAIVALVAIVLGAIAFVLFVRRRRRAGARGAPPPGAPPPGAPPPGAPPWGAPSPGASPPSEATKEAW